MHDLNDEVVLKRHQLEEFTFYAHAGRCVIRFQQLEDNLKSPFSTLLSTSPEHAQIIFASVRTVKRRCDVIGDLIKLDKPALLNDWDCLSKRILKAENNRNSIAHARSVFNGGGATIHFNHETDSLTVTEVGDPFFYLEKKGFLDWTVERLLAEANNTGILIDDLHRFDRLLAAAIATEHS